MNTRTDWHYHISGRKIKEDVSELKNYLKTMDEVYVLATYFPDKRSGVSNYNLYHHLKNVEKTKLFLSLDFENYFFQGYNEIKNLIEEDREKIKGIKIYTGYQRICFNEDFHSVLELAQKHNLYVMFHTGFLNHSENAYNPNLLSDVFEKYPKINFIIAHLGNPFIKITMDLLNKYNNVYTDISGLTDKESEKLEIVRMLKDISKKVNHKKVLFGTDHPVQNYNTTKEFSDYFKQ